MQQVTERERIIEIAIWAFRVALAAQDGEIAVVDDSWRAKIALRELTAETNAYAELIGGDPRNMAAWLELNRRGPYRPPLE